MRFILILLVQIGACVLGSPVPTPISLTDTHSLRTVAINSTQSKTETVPFPFEDTEDNINSLASAFDFVSNAPNGSQQEVQEWFHAHKAEYFHSNSTVVTGTLHQDRGRDTKIEARLDVFKIANCVSTLAQVLLSIELPEAEVLRLKTLIKALGGGYKVAKALIKARSLADLYAISADWEQLINLLLGINDVASACF